MNLPARAVVVRDTQVGLNGIDVALVQQMFGRAGRIGAGERDGWAYLITDENEHPAWQARLIAGYHVSSKILASLPDHVRRLNRPEVTTIERSGGRETQQKKFARSKSPALRPSQQSSSSSVGR